MLVVELPDGSRRQFDSPQSVSDVAAAIGPGLAKSALVAEVDGQQVDLATPLPAEGEVKLRLLTKRDPESLAVMRHSCAHVAQPPALVSTMTFRWRIRLAKKTFRASKRK